MFDQNFAKRNDNLFENYRAVRFFGLLLAAACCFVSGITSGGFDTPTQDSPVGQTLFLLAISLILAQALARHLIRERLKKQLWAAYLAASDGTELPVKNRFYKSQVGPVVRDGSSSIALNRSIRGEHFGYKTNFQSVRVNHNATLLAKDDLSFNIELLVLAVDLKQKVPHIFIDGKSQNKKSSTNKNLWFLSSKLDKHQKIQALEGDFENYFDIYAAPENIRAKYAREIDVLSLLSPDAMLALRNEGYDFDYEFHNNHLYIIHEPDILTTYEFEAYMNALETSLKQLLPQITGHSFAVDGAELKTHVSRFNTNDTISLWAKIFMYMIAGFSLLMLGGFIAGI